MAEVVSFEIEGDFAAFHDPSVTTNQTSYIIPSKSSVIGLIGAMIGVKRPNTLRMLYCPEMLNLMRSTSIGIKVMNQPKKVTFYTNHISLKESKTKPFKVELLLFPHYTIFTISNATTIERLVKTLKNHSFVYSPVFGHTYCPARILSYAVHEAKEVPPKDRHVASVILDEAMETENNKSAFKWAALGEKQTRVVIERHLHHYFKQDELERRVLRHWIPIPVEGQESQFKIISFSSPLGLTKFFELDGVKEKTICLY